MWWLILFLAQDPQIHAQQVRAAMEASIAKQRASVQQQTKNARPVAATVTDAACEPIAAPELDRMIDSTAHQQKVDPKLVREVARQESGFRPCAVSSKGAQGLMQLMPATQVTLEVHNPFDPQESLTGGTKLLKQLLDRYNGDLALALSAYNAGATRVDQTSAVPEIPETKDYVSSILDRLKQ